MTENNTFYCSFVGNQFIICECGDTFPNEDELREHLEKDPKHITTFTEYKCGECSKIYATELECMNHQELEHVPYLKDDHSYMKEEIEDAMELQEGLNIKQESSTIKEEQIHIADMEFVKEEIYDDGQSYYIEQVITDEGQEIPLGQTAEVVQFGLEKPRGKKQEVQVTTQVRVKTEEKRKKPVIQKNIVCEICGKKYASAAVLRYHQRVHSGVRPFQCTYCPKSFTMGLFLQIHIRTHTGERPYSCSECPKAFSNKAALLRHDRVHTGAKPYECPQCGKTFTQSNSMKLHVHTVHLKLPAPYKSKRRKAESQARVARGPKKTKKETQAKDAQPVKLIEASLDLIEETYPQLKATEVYYCNVPVKDKEVTYELLPAKEEEVAYELIYE